MLSQQMIFEWIFLKYIAGFLQFERSIAWNMMKQNLRTKITIDFYQQIVKFGLFSSPYDGGRQMGQVGVFGYQRVFLSALTKIRIFLMIWNFPNKNYIFSIQIPYFYENSIIFNSQIKQAMENRNSYRLRPRKYSESILSKYSAKFICLKVDCSTSRLNGGLIELLPVYNTEFNVQMSKESVLSTEPSLSGQLSSLYDLSSNFLQMEECCSTDLYLEENNNFYETSIIETRKSV